MKSKRKSEDRTVLAWLYDVYRQTYPQSVENMQREIEELYEGIHHHPLPNSAEIAAVFVALCDDNSRYAFEEGVRTGVQLALDLELDSMMGGCAECF